MSVLSIQAVSKRYPGGHVDVLRDFHLDVQSGEILCLVGESGSGKTTLLRLIAGFDTPTRGSISLAGQTLCDDTHFMPPERRAVGMVFQDFALFPHYTVEKNITYGIHTLSRADRHARVSHMLEITGLQGLERRYPHELSGGQQQRVALARALAPNPALLLLDEPFAALNDSLRESVRDELATIIRATGTTALLVTHDIKDAFAIADRVAILRDGQLLQIGAPQDVYAHPSNGYVAHFFGKTNLIDGQTAAGGHITPIGFIATDADTAPESASANATGDPVTLSIRPESIELVAADTPHAARGRVSRIKFAGQYKELTLCMDSTTVPKCHLTVFVPADTDVAPDQFVTIRPRPDKVKIVG